MHSKQSDDGRVDVKLVAVAMLSYINVLPTQIKLFKLVYNQKFGQDTAKLR